MRTLEFGGLLGVVLSTGIALSAAQASTPKAGVAKAELERNFRQCVLAEAGGSQRIAKCTSVISAGGLSNNWLAHAHISRGIELNYRGDTAAALQDFNAALTLDPANASALYSRGLAYSDIGETDKALADLDTVIARHPGKAVFYRDRARVEMQRDAFDRAVADLDIAIKLEPGEAYGFILRGNARLDSGDPKSAMPDYDTAIRLDPDSASAHENRGHARYRVGDLDGALADLDVAIKHEATASAFVKRGFVYDAQERLEAAIADYTHALTMTGNSHRHQAHISRAISYRKQGKLADVAADLAAALAMRPDRIETHLDLAETHAALRDYDRALEASNGAVAAFPDDPRSYQVRADIREKRNESAEAQADQAEAKRREYARFKAIFSPRTN